MRVATLDQLAQQVHGEVVGDGKLEIRGAAALDKAGAHEISFAGDERHVRELKGAQAGACLVARSLLASASIAEASPALVFVDDPLDAFVAILSRFRPQPERSLRGISVDAWVDATAVIGADCNVYPGVFVDAGAVVGARCDLYPGVFVGRDCRIGDDCVLYPHAVLYPEVAVGNRVLVHAGVVLGADGFGFRFRKGRFEKIPQQGWVEVQDDCEIGANTTIDRGMIGPTVIGTGTKLDDQVMVGHNCEIGRHNVFASQVGLAGSATTGDYVRLAGQVGIADHVHVGKGATIGAKAGVHRSVPDGETHIGIPARREQEELKILMTAAKLPEMRRRLRDLEEKVEALARLSESTVPSGERGLKAG